MQGMTFGPTTSSLAQGSLSQIEAGYGRTICGTPLRHGNLSKQSTSPLASIGRCSRWFLSTFVSILDRTSSLDCS